MDLKDTGVIFARDSAWLLPALLAVVIACYAVVVAGGPADLGTPIRKLRSWMTSISILIGTFAWLWGGALVLEASFGHLELPLLWAPLTLTAIIAFISAGFVSFDHDPPHVRASLLKAAMKAHREAKKLSNLSPEPEANLRWKLVRTRTTLTLIGIGFVGSLIYVLGSYFFETDPGQRSSNLWLYLPVLLLDFIIWFGWTVAGLWGVLDHALVCRTRAIWSQRSFLLFVGICLGVYLLLLGAMAFAQDPGERSLFVASNGIVLCAIVLLTWVSPSRQSRKVRSYQREERAEKLIEKSQKELYKEHPELRPPEAATASSRGETVKAAIINLVAAVLNTKRLSTLDE